jgi:hypothetical protein
VGEPGGHHVDISRQEFGIIFFIGEGQLFKQVRPVVKIKMRNISGLLKAYCVGDFSEQ